MSADARDFLTPQHIGTLGERSLHAALKVWYGRAGDRYEVEVNGYVIDIVRDQHLIEIQTANFTAFRRKLNDLLADYPITVIYPVAAEKWIVRETAAGDPVSRRKSPKRGRVHDVFQELVRIPHLLPHPHLHLLVLLTQQEEILRDDGRGSWRRRGWSIADRRLLAVTGEHYFANTTKLLSLLPQTLPQPFTNKQLAATLNCPPRLAQKMTYTLYKSNQLQRAGKQGNAHLYQPAN